MADTPAQPPPGVEPMMMSMKNMDKYGLKNGEGLKDVIDYKIFSKQEALDEIAAIGFYSAFHPFHDKLKEYPSDEILVIADREEIYGQNWMICVTEEARDRELENFERVKRAEAEAEQKRLEEEEARRLAEEEEARRVYEDLPLIARPYVSETIEQTENEIQLQTIQPSRPKLSFTFSRQRKYFGAPCTLSDRENEGHAIEFRTRKEPNYELTRKELSVGLQARPGCMSGHANMSTQTAHNRKVNNSTQSENTQATTFTDEDIAAILRGPSMQEFLYRVLPAAEHALQQNETLNIFEDELSRMEEEEGVVAGGGGDAVARELKTFMDLENAKDKCLSSIDWHPRSSSWLAASTMPNWTFEERVAASGSASVSFILLYHFAEFSSQVILESPHDVTMFRWNPRNPDQLVAGCVTGQLLYFDLTDAREVLARRTKQGGSGDSGSSQDQDRALRLRHTFSTNIDTSHRRPVTDLCWLPPSHQISNKLKFKENTDGESTQVISTSGDGLLMVWDITFQKKAQGRRRSVVDAGAAGLPQEDDGHKKKEDEEVPWNPLYATRALLPGGQHPVCIRQFLLHPTPSHPVYITTEDGQIGQLDWAPPGQGTGLENANAHTNDDAEGDPSRLLWLQRDHSRPSRGLQRSPFFPNLLLHLSDHSFSLWLEGMKHPLFTAPRCPVELTTGCWSPTRPAVVFVGRADGTMDVWDMVDQTTKPSLNLFLVSTPVTSISFRPSSVSKTQLLAVGDTKGYLHVFDLPVTLRRSTTRETGLMEDVIKREQEHVAYVLAQQQVRDRELVEKQKAADLAEQEREAAAARVENELAAYASRMGLSSVEEVDREAMQAEKEAQQEEQESAAYLELETQLMEQLGIGEDYLRASRWRTEGQAGGGGGDLDATQETKADDEGTVDLDGVDVDLADSMKRSRAGSRSVNQRA